MNLSLLCLCGTWGSMAGVAGSNQGIKKNLQWMGGFPTGIIPDLLSTGSPGR